MLLNKTLDESIDNKSLFAYCALGRMVFSSHPAFYSTSFQVHPGLNELHVMSLGSRKTVFFISPLRFDSRSILFSSMLPTLCCVPEATDLCWSLSPLPVSVALPDMGKIQGRCNLFSLQKVQLIKAYEC